MENLGFNSADLPLKVSQIVCLEHQNSNLYGEVIQLIPHRQLCWFRPLCLVISNSLASSFQIQNAGEHRKSTEANKLIDLQAGADLLWPACWFRPALDTEIIHWLTQLKDASLQPQSNASNQKYLKQFIDLFWQIHQDKF